MNLDDLFRATASQQPKKPAILMTSSQKTITYDELSELIGQCSDAMSLAGIKAKDCIAIHIDSSANYIILTYAAWRIGACVIPMATEASVLEKHRICDEICIQGIVCSREDREILTRVEDPSFSDIGFGAIYCPITPSCQHPIGFDEINPAFIRFSSGTTGTAKGVILGHETILLRIQAANEVLCIGEEDKVIWLLSMAYHFAVSIVAYLSFGATIILLDRPNGLDIINAVKTTQATIIYGAPTHYEWMIESAKGSVDKLQSVRLAIATTCAIKQTLSRAMLSKLGVSVNRALGIIEVGLFCIDTDPNDGSSMETIGKVLPAYTVKLSRVSLESNIKEILVSGPGMFDAYYSPFTARKQLLRNGFFPTGDTGDMTSNGHLILTGRIKELINVGGLKVFPSEIEDIINSVEGVSESCAFSVTDKALGEVPVVSITFQDGSDVKILYGKVMSACTTHLPALAVPVKIQFVHQLPRTPSGKLIRRSEVHFQLPPIFTAYAGGEASASSHTNQITRNLDRATVEKEVRNLWSQLLGSLDFSEASNFFANGGDSIKAASLCSLLELRFKCLLSPASIFRFPTIDEQVLLILNAYAGHYATLLGEKKGLKALVTLQPDGTEAPLFIVHGVNGRLGSKVELARKLAPTRPVYGLHAIEGSENNTGQSIEDMAELYADEILRFQPTGTIHLMGYSAGGWYAYAVASQIYKKGEASRLGALLIIDSQPIPNIKVLAKVKVAVSIVKREVYLALANSDTDKTSLGYVGRFIGLLQTLNYYFENAHLPSYGPWNRKPFFEYYSKIANEYRPKPLPIKANLITVSSSCEMLSGMWSLYALGGLSVENMFEDHFDFMRPELQGELAEKVQCILNKIDLR